MIRHAPPGYDCPFCAVAAGRDTEHNRASDLVLRDDETTAFVAPKWWNGNPGHVLVIPNEHYENVYEIPDVLLGRVHASAGRVARMLRDAYGCDGTSTRQHNEPAGNQDVWHLHVHVFPRYDGDRLYERHGETRWPSPEERAVYAERLRAATR